MDETNKLADKVLDWLNTQGYPLEFQTAAAFERRNFDVTPSMYQPDPISGSLREVDVVANLSMERPRDSAGRYRYVRVEYAIECKYTKDKPWVVFASRAAAMAPSARIAHTIASPLGATIMWTLAGDLGLQALDIFSSPSRPAFGGRQVFDKDRDAFYSAVQSVVAAARALADRYAPEPEDPLEEALSSGVVVFPVVIIEGHLFESWLDRKANKIVVEERDHLRLHWRGSEHASIATVDLVTAHNLDQFVELRRTESRKLLKRMVECAGEIDQCVAQGTLDGLEITSGPRGIVGLPPLLYRVVSTPEGKESKNQSSE